MSLRNGASPSPFQELRKHTSSGRNKNFSGTYQTYETTTAFSKEPVKPSHGAAGNVNSFYEFKFKANDPARPKIPNKLTDKKGKSKKRLEQVRQSTKPASAQLYQTIQADMYKTVEVKKPAQGREPNYTDSRKSRPYGLRKQFEDLVTDSDEATTMKRNFPLNSKSNDLAEKSETPFGKEKPVKTKVVDNFKNFVPTTSDEIKMLIENDFKRHSSRFARRKDQDELTNRLLSHKEKFSKSKEFTKFTIDREEPQSAIRGNHKYEAGKPLNQKSFNENQLEYELIKKHRLAMLANRKESQELAEMRNPAINKVSKQLATSQERQGKVHERLHKQCKQKVIEKAQEAADTTSNDKSAERVSSCHRKGLQQLLAQEQKELTFRPKIHKKSYNLSRDRKIEERLLEDAHKRKVRQSNREKQEIRRIKNANFYKGSERSNQYAYKIFEKDFNSALEKFSKSQADSLDFADL